MTIPDRRSFLKRSAITLAGGLFVPGLPKHLGEKSSTFQLTDFWENVRHQFPLTDKRTYFNNGTIGPSPYPVLKAVQTTMVELNTWGEYGGHDDAIKPISEFVNSSEDEIALTHNTTEGINIVASGLPLNKGDEVIVTTHEHAGNALPWLNQQKHKGIVLKTFVPRPTSSENLNAINDLINPKTRVIAVPHITCTTGHILPAREISTLGHDKGLWVFFDGAHGAGSLNLDVADIGCDFYATCGHKWLLGPSGTGFLYVRKGVLNDLVPVNIGAYSDTGWEISEKRQTLSGYVDTAHRFDYGTQSAALSHGIIAAVRFMREIGMKKIGDYSASLSSLLYEGLLNVGDPVEILTPAEKESRNTMVSFRIKDMDYKTFGTIASKNKFRIRLVPESGLNAIRISTHIYNTPDQINEFIDLIMKTVKS